MDLKLFNYIFDYFLRIDSQNQDYQVKGNKHLKDLVYVLPNFLKFTLIFIPLCNIGGHLSYSIFRSIKRSHFKTKSWPVFVCILYIMVMLHIFFYVCWPLDFLFLIHFCTFMQFVFIGVSIGIQGTNDRAGYPPSTAFFKFLVISWLYYLTLRIIFLFLKLSACLKIYLGVLWCFVYMSLLLGCTVF